VRGTILIDKLRDISGRLGAPTPIAESFCRFDELPWGEEQERSQWRKAGDRFNAGLDIAIRPSR
jgi:hypothetical protein